MKKSYCAVYRARKRFGRRDFGRMFVTLEGEAGLTQTAIEMLEDLLEQKFKYKRAIVVNMIPLDDLCDECSEINYSDY